MADLTSAGVTLDTAGSYSVGSRHGKFRGKKIAVTLVLVAQGDGTAGNNIPATALGLTKILEVYPLVKDDSSLAVVGAPNYAGDSIILKAAATNAPAQYTGTFKTVVFGY